jgi:cysteinyl-tRNA synthetase
MHNGLLKMGKGKMAGSVGNVLNVADVLKRVSGEVLRFFLISTHYRSPIDLGDFDPKTQELPPGIVNAQKGYEAFVRFAERYERITGKSFQQVAAPTRASEGPRSFRIGELEELRRRFMEHMDDDFNTGGAVGVLFELVTALNRYADEKKLEDPATAQTEGRTAFAEGSLLLKELGQILGLFYEAPKSAVGDDRFVNGLMQLVIDLRNNLRAEAKKIAGKDDPAKKALFEQTDLIRKRLGELGVILEDRPGGTGWRRG